MHEPEGGQGGQGLKLLVYGLLLKDTLTLQGLALLRPLGKKL